MNKTNCTCATTTKSFGMYEKCRGCLKEENEKLKGMIDCLMEATLPLLKEIASINKYQDKKK
jgi:hypothetical protein